MSTKKQKIGEIFSSLQSDLLLLNEAVAARFVKRAFTFENPATNFEDALRNIMQALDQINMSLKYLPMLARSGRVKDSTALSSELRGLQKGLSSLAVAFERESKNFDKSGYWKNKAPLFLRKKREEMKAMVEAAASNKIIHSAFFDSPQEESVKLMSDFLSDAIDEVENTLDALDEPLEGPSASMAQPDAAAVPSDQKTDVASGDEASQAYDTYILGGKKALDEFFDKYNVEQDPKDPNFIKEYFDIVKKNIIDNKDVQRLMFNADKEGEARERLIRMPRFSDVAKRAYDAVTAQIQIASDEIDQSEASLPER